MRSPSFGFLAFNLFLVGYYFARIWHDGLTWSRGILGVLALILAAVEVHELRRRRAVAA